MSVAWFAYAPLEPDSGRTSALLSRGEVAPCRADCGLWRGLLAALRPDPRQDPPIEKRRRLSTLPHRQARLGFCLGGDAAGQSHPPAAAARPGPCAGLLGLLRLCAGHAEPLRDRAGAWLSLDPQGLFGRFYFDFAAVFALACAVGILGSLRPPVSGAAQMAGREALVGIGPDCVSDLPADGDLSGGILRCRHRRGGAGSVVGAHAYAADFSAAHSAYQAPASGAEPGHYFSFARRIQPDSSARGRRGFWAGGGHGPDAAGQPAGLLLRGVRALHRALPRHQYRQAAQPEGNHSGLARLPERPRPGGDRSRCWASTTRRRLSFSAPPAGPANFSARWASSICRSSSGCGAAR